MEPKNNQKVKLKVSLTGIEFEALGYSSEDASSITKRVLIFTSIIGMFIVLIKILSLF